MKTHVFAGYGNTRVVTIWVLQEMPMNAYFGGTLCTADVNRDGVDDLLVGAMLYSPSLLGGGQLEDVGAVFLYLGPFNVCLW